MSNLDVYLDDFDSIIQGGPKEKRQMLRNLFIQIEQLFRPNKVTDTDWKKPISLNKLGQGGGYWSTQNIVLG